MKLFKYIINFLFSLRTTLWLVGFMLMLMLAGAFIMPGKQEFRALHSMPLFDWMQQQPLRITWWLWGLTGILFVLTLNTLFCSIESIVKKRKITRWLLLISPQVIHIGFLFMLLAHLLSAVGALQSQAIAAEGTMVKLSGRNTALKVKHINISLDYYGYISDWAVRVEYLSDGKVFQEDIIKPNSPSTQMGFNINVKNIRPHPEAVLLQINREPGAVWALIGSILFMLGIVTLILLKIRMEK